MAKEDWIKIHTDIIDDVKIRRLSKIPESFKMWVGILCLCRRDGIENCVCINENIPYEPQELSEILAVSHRDFIEFLKEAEKLRMIEINDGFIFILNWDKRQYIDNGRVKNFRKKQKQNTSETDMKQKRNDIETEVKRLGNAPETPLKQNGNKNETVEQNRAEQKQNREEQTAEQSRERNADETQKQIPVAAAVASFASALQGSAAAASPGGGYRPVASELVKIGVSLQKTEELMGKYTEESIRNQIDWLPFRNLKKPVAGLIKAIEQNWEMPDMPQTEKQKAEMEFATKLRKCAEKYPDCAKLGIDICSQCPNVLKKLSEKPDT